MRGQQRELAAGIHLHIHLGKPAPDTEALPAQLKTGIGVRTARGKGKPAQNGHMDVRITPGDMLPMREVETLRLQGRPQLQQSRDTAHLLQGEHIWVERADALAHLGLGGSGFDAAPGRGVIEIVFNIVGGDAKGFSLGRIAGSLNRRPLGIHTLKSIFPTSNFPPHVRAGENRPVSTPAVRKMNLPKSRQNRPCPALAKHPPRPAR